MASIDDVRVIKTARARGILLIPLVDCEDPAYARTVLASPASRAANVATLIRIVTSHDYDGIELDYEHLWQASDRAGFVALVAEMATFFFQAEDGIRD